MLRLSLILLTLSLALSVFSHGMSHTPLRVQRRSQVDGRFGSALPSVNSDVNMKRDYVSSLEPRERESSLRLFVVGDS